MLYACFVLGLDSLGSRTCNMTVVGFGLCVFALSIILLLNSLLQVFLLQSPKVFILNMKLWIV